MDSAPSHTLAEFIENSAFRNPDKIIFSDKDELNQYTLEELNNRSNLLAKGLLYHGVHKNTPVALVAAKTTNYICMVFALAKIGALLIPIPQSLPVQNFRSLLSNEKIHTIGFYSDTFLSIIKNSIPEFIHSERGYLKSTDFPHLKNMVNMGNIKNRGIFTLHELMLLGSHIDDIEMESSSKIIIPNDCFIKMIDFDTNNQKKTKSETHADILSKYPTFAELQQHILNIF